MSMASGSGYGYDNAGRALGGYTPDFWDTGGPHRSAAYLYDKRDNITRFRITPDPHDYTFTYGSNGAQKDHLQSIAWGSSVNRTNFDYDADGRVTRLYGVNDSLSLPVFETNFLYESSDAISPGSMTALGAAAKMTAGGTSYVLNYWYDNQQRRQQKVYAVNDAYDLFLYDWGVGLAQVPTTGCVS
jgi:hypothetical protein